MDIRDAEEYEVEALAKIWYDGWNDAHAQIVPAELKRIRTLESFTERMRAAIRDRARRWSTWRSGRIPHAERR